MAARGLVRGDVLNFFLHFACTSVLQVSDCFHVSQTPPCLPIQNAFTIKILILLIPEPLPWQNGPKVWNLVVLKITGFKR